MYYAEVTKSTGLGMYTTSYESSVEIQIEEWTNGLAISAPGELFVFINYASLISVKLGVEHEEKEDVSAPEG